MRELTICASCVHYRPVVTPGFDTLELAFGIYDRCNKYDITEQRDLVTGIKLKIPQSMCRHINHGYCEGYEEDPNYIPIAVGTFNDPGDDK